LWVHRFCTHDFKRVGKDKGLTKLFLEFPVALYATDANRIRPLDKDIEAIFDHQKNGHFAHGEAIRWVLFDKNNEGKLVGSLHFISNHRVQRTKCPSAVWAFSECIEDFESAKCLFDACKEWLVARGLEAMDGPINFGERDSFLGIDG
jgi:hypothetical protein